MERDDLTYQFADLGDQFYYLAIATILSFVPYLGSMASILQIVFIIIILGRINKINYHLKSPHLKNFRLRIIYSYLVLIFGSIGLIIGIIGIAFLFTYITPIKVIAFFIPSVVIAVLGIIITSVILEIYAWMSLGAFFEEMKPLLPEFIARDCTSGAKRIKQTLIAQIIVSAIIITIIAVIVSVLLYYPNFTRTVSGSYLIAPLILYILGAMGLGFIIVVFRTIGFFKLAHLRELRYLAYQKTSINIQGDNITPSIQKTKINAGGRATGVSVEFCPYCGEKIEYFDAIFCSTCGKRITG